MTQRSRRDKRHPMVLAPIPGAPRPLTSLQRPARIPLSPPVQSFPWPGSDPGLGSVGVSRSPRPRWGTFPSFTRAPSPPSRSLRGAPGCWGPRRRAHPPSGRPRGEGTGRGRPRSALRLPLSLDRTFRWFSVSFFRSSRRLWSQHSALRSSALGSYKPRPAPSPPAARRVPRSPLRGHCGARPPAPEAEQLASPGGPATAPPPNFLWVVWNLRGGAREMLTPKAG